MVNAFIFLQEISRSWKEFTLGIIFLHKLCYTARLRNTIYNPVATLRQNRPKRLFTWKRPVLTSTKELG